MRTGSRLIVFPVVALATAGCLATKGDIRLLQDELRASRAQVARSDSAHRLTSDSLGFAISALAIAQGRGDESLLQAQQAFKTRTESDIRALTSRFSNLEITMKEQFRAQSALIDEVKEAVRQNSKNISSATMPAPRVIPPTPGDTTGAVPPVTSGPTSPEMLQAGRGAAYGGSCKTARRNFNELLTQFPTSLEAPEALYLIGESYATCAEGGNLVSADSVYQLVTLRYPKADRAADALYKRAEMARAAGKTSEAQKLYQRVVCEYRNSAVFTQAREKLTTPGRCV